MKFTYYERYYIKKKCTKCFIIFLQNHNLWGILQNINVNRFGKVRA